MAYRPLELTLVSAKDLKDVNLFSKMEVYAVASLSNDPRSKQRTHADREGGRNPSWNCPIRFSIPVSADLNHLFLRIRLRAERALGDRDVGEVQVPIKELDSAGNAAKHGQFVSYQVRRPSGKPKGVLNFSYKFGDKVGASPAPATYPPPSAYTTSKADEPVTAYPVGASAAYPVGTSAAYPPPGPSKAYPAPGASVPYPQAGYPVYPPPPHGYGYSAPPPAGYGYPQAPGYGYGAPPVVQAQPPPRKNKFGMGLGAGLLGGALGGLLIGDMISDAGAYDGGYDGGFDDGGGFDF